MSKIPPTLIGPHGGSKGSWFSLSHYSKTDYTSYDFKSFVELLEKQALAHLQTDLITNRTVSEFSVQNVQISISEKQFEDIVRIQAEEENPLFFPLITFHSTQSPTKVNSILSNGYIIPGEQHPTQGYTVRMQNGNLYGDGIYSSNNFNAIKWYSFIDQRISIQVIINIIFVKRYKVVPFGAFVDIPTLSVHRGVYYEYQKPPLPAAYKELKHIKNFAIPNLPPVYHEYDTLISDDGKIFVTGNPQHIIPVGLLTVGIVNQGKDYVDHVSSLTSSLPIHDPIPSFMQHFTRAKGISYLSRVRSNIKIPSYHFFGEVNYLDTSVLSRIHGRGYSHESDLLIKHLFIIPPSILSDHLLIGAINSFINTIVSDSTDITRPRTHPRRHDIVKAVSYYSNQFHRLDAPDSFLGHSKSVKGHHTTDGITSALEALCHYLTNDERRLSDEKIQIVYFFVAHPQPHGRIREVLDKWNKYLSVQNIIFKLIFLYDYHEDLVEIKSAVQTMFHFEANHYHRIQSVSTVVGKKKKHVTNKTSSSTVSSDLPPKSLEEVFEILTDEINTLYETADPIYRKYTVPYPLGVVGEGFLPSFQEQPVWDYGSNSHDGVLYKGFLTHVKIDNEFYEVEHQPVSLFADREHKEDKKTKNYDENKKRKDYTVTKIKEKSGEIDDKQVVATFKKEMEGGAHQARVMESVLDLFIILLNKFRLFVFQFPSRCHYFLPRILPFYSQLHRYLTQPHLSHLLGFQNPTLLVAMPMTTIKQFLFQLKALISDVISRSEIKFSDKWFQTFRNMRFRKKIQRRFTYKFDVSSSTSLQYHLKQCSYFSFKVKEVSDLLQIVSADVYYGVLMRVKRAESSNIEPWLLIIEYLSQDESDIASIYVKNEFQTIVDDYDPSSYPNEETRLVDRRREKVSDVLYLPHFYSSEQQVGICGSDKDDVVKLYYAYVFTRLPYCYHPSQLIALPTIALVAYIHQAYMMILFKHFRHIEYDVHLCDTLLDKAFSLIPVVQSLFQQCAPDVASEFIKHVNQEENVEQYLLEGNDVPSICKIVGILCLSEAQTLIASDLQTGKEEEVGGKSKWNRLCFALLAEAIMRSCKAYLKSTRQNSTDVIRQILQIYDQTDVNAYHLNLPEAIQATNKIMLNTTYSNCTPYAVMSSLLFLESYHRHQMFPTDQQWKDEIKKDFHKGNYLPRDFLFRHYGGSGKGKIIQIALFLSAMKYSSSRLRQANQEALMFENPRKIVDDVIREQLRFIQFRQQLSRTLQNRIQTRLLDRINQALPYQTFHQGMPRLFTAQEIDELNLSRPPDDQFTLMSSGLLFHHCCYVSCPLYLQNLASESDRLSVKKYPKQRQHWKNHGLNHHLENSRLLHLYIPRFHLTAQNILFQCSSSHPRYQTSHNEEEDFKGFKTEMRNQLWQKLEYFQGDFDEALREVYKAYKR